ncbi:hypothetical protein CHS0354_010023 [Potamilus streckersoni]|uniref:Uncharacterized protein n=1 Tax=Potamilus streckersoni TaxID=2493646 RepID=A0AAE0SCH6_9BIVA|nr:hypothetical protein CHS0354_010023 [Potamilus streckersoni]
MVDTKEEQITLINEALNYYNPTERDIMETCILKDLEMAMVGIFVMRSKRKDDLKTLEEKLKYERRILIKLNCYPKNTRLNNANTNGTFTVSYATHFQLDDVQNSHGTGNRTDAGIFYTITITPGVYNQASLLQDFRIPVKSHHESVPQEIEEIAPSAPVHGVMTATRPQWSVSWQQARKALNQIQKDGTELALRCFQEYLEKLVSSDIRKKTADVRAAASGGSGKQILRSVQARRARILDWVDAQFSTLTVVSFHLNDQPLARPKPYNQVNSTAIRHCIYCRDLHMVKLGRDRIKAIKPIVMRKCIDRAFLCVIFDPQHKLGVGTTLALDTQRWVTPALIL